MVNDVSSISRKEPPIVEGGDDQQEDMMLPPHTTTTTEYHRHHRATVAPPESPENRLEKAPAACSVFRRAAAVSASLSCSAFLSPAPPFPDLHRLPPTPSSHHQVESQPCLAGTATNSRFCQCLLCFSLFCPAPPGAAAAAVPQPSPATSGHQTLPKTPSNFFHQPRNLPSPPEPRNSPQPLPLFLLPCTRENCLLQLLLAAAGTSSGHRVPPPTTITLPRPPRTSTVDPGANHHPPIHETAPDPPQFPLFLVWAAPFGPEQCAYELGRGPNRLGP
ncbi:extensin-like [Rhodamnia argentea]|uniref:Extensin-like n=1 Tax=Rhodamnia argentea TaxID=178133 RepID=A0ABM3HGM0_9MYRT|nr:extensin-like [Rhodamnia argentea]